MNCMVTGGTGFIGSHVVDVLQANGSEVAVMDNLSSGNVGNLSEKTSLQVGNVRDKQAVGTAVLDDVDCVFHLATQIDVLRALEDPGLDAQVNVGGTVNVLNACVEAHVRRFIVSSTGGAPWGIPSALPATDRSAIQPCASNLDRGRGDDLARDLMDRGLIACTATDAHDATHRVPCCIFNEWGTVMLLEAE